MKDQLHRFASASAAEAAFPRPLDDDGQPIRADAWTVDDGQTSVLPLTVFVMDAGKVRPSTEVWVGVSTGDQAKADALWALPSAAVELAMPAEPTFWTGCVTRSRLPAEVGATVMGVSPLFAGRAYLFPEWPGEDEESE